MSQSVLSRCARRVRALVPRLRPRLRLAALGVAGSLLLLPLSTRANDPTAELPLRVLIVGGGPDLANNQVAIESNVRYVSKLLPSNALHTTLFADGDANHSTVLFDDDTHVLPIGEHILSLISPYAADDTSGHYRKPNLGVKVDGASRNADISRVFGEISQDESANANGHRILLYFTGHGSPGRNDLENNMYDLWEEPRDNSRRETTNLTVRELARQIARLPNDVPVTVVMVQCFSGAFGNLLFENGDPNGDPVKRDLCGFFATVKERVAAGCTSAVNEAEYRDFTSFFFAALTGRDRVGRRVTGADYNGDGRVSMDEAFCYTLIHDDSIDVPVCTSDVFLRRFVPDNDRELFQTASYNNTRTWATPAQQAALDALSEKLRLGGNNRLGAAYNMMLGVGSTGRRPSPEVREARRRFQSIQNDGKAMLARQFPDLKLSSPALRRDARQAAIAQLTREAGQGKWKDLLDADAVLDKAERDSEAQEIADSQVIRFVRLAKSVILAHRLRESNEAGLKTRFARLIEAESRTPLPPADTQPRETASVPVRRAVAAVRSHAASREDCGCGTLSERSE
jgi:hypothetical protein